SLPILFRCHITVAAAYEADRDRYMAPEQASIRYVQLRRDRLVASQTVSEDELQQAYDEYLSREAVREQRQASHILLETADRSRDEALELAVDLRARLAAGESFADLAKEYSDDFATRDQGGDLDRKSTRL